MLFISLNVAFAIDLLGLNLEINGHILINSEGFNAGAIVYYY